LILNLVVLPNFAEEVMLTKTPAFAIDIIELLPPRPPPPAYVSAPAEETATGASTADQSFPSDSETCPWFV
jgi:hypothetical protein